MKTMNKPDDRIFVETRVAAGLVILVLLLAFVALYIFPQNTDTDFAWTITPSTTAVLMGAGYIAGGYFFLRVLTEKKWHRVQAGFLPITAFTIFMLGATILHLGRFHAGAFQFYLWTVVYIVTPFLVPLLWWHNHASDPGTLEEGDLRFSSGVRWILALVGLVVAAGMLLFFVQPASLISIAPWKLTELTARVGAGWGMLTALTMVSIAHDGRWSGARILSESAAIGPALMLFAFPRISGDFDWANPASWAFVGGLAAALVFLVLVHLLLDRQRTIAPLPA
jgi:hypothetical protein